MTPRSRTGLYLHAFLLQLAAYVIRPTAAYQALELGADPVAVGLVGASFALLPLLLAVWVGRWIDRGNGSAALLWGAVAMTAAGLGLLLSPASLSLLILWNALIGLGHLLGILGEQSAIARGNRGSTDTAFGRYTFVVSAGQAVAPLLIIFLGGTQIIPDTRGLIIAFTVCCALLTLLSAVLGRSAARLPRPSVPQTVPSFREGFRVEPGKRRIMVGAISTSMFVLAAIDLLQVYLPALGAERGIPAWIIGLLLSIRAIATMLSRLRLAALSSRFGRGPLVTWTTVIGAGTLAALAAPMHPVLMALLLIVCGAALGIGQPLSMSLIALAAPPATIATWLALRLSANRLGQSVIPAGLGLFALGGTVGPVLIASGGLLLGSALISHAALRGSDDL